MRPLVLYCRWYQARIRLHGRNDVSVWGELAFADGRRQPFRYLLDDSTLKLGGSDDTWLNLQLDEQGVIINQDDA